ncbi:hypothetical protein AMATHDRAFT_149372 [Amanita thiersii Skay4041]|uniref:Uncharacterized protein n=1 Tax=Amanita thiersii Skay4041 TaxID=703135 RepID=A0A2A9NLU3_9AGAR|nr:hypothetical protein AMATHDRAFT_149372 [Amanita thiersii Skay4041]
MPIPGTPNAPLFSGTNIKDFLDILESLAEAAQIPVSKLPKYVLRYCHNSVKDVIMNCELLDGDDWARVRDLMMELYASNDKPRLISANRFRKWIQNHAETASFDSETDIDEYYQNFVMKSGGLVKQELLGKKEQSILFFKGIPNPTRRRIYKRLPLDHSSTTSPPSTTQVLKLLRREFSEDRLDYEDDDCDDMSANEDDEGNEAEEIPAKEEANH